MADNLYNGYYAPERLRELKAYSASLDHSVADRFVESYIKPRLQRRRAADESSPSESPSSPGMTENKTGTDAASSEQAGLRNATG